MPQVSRNPAVPRNSAVRKAEAIPSAGTGATNVLRTVAGTTWVFSGAEGPALNAPIGLSSFAILDPNNNVIFSDRQNSMVFRLGGDGVLHVVAGNGLPGFSGDGGPATQAQLSEPSGVAQDTAGNIYVVDVGNQRVRKIDTNGIITTVAGTGFVGSAIENDLAVFSDLDFGLDAGIAADSAGAVYFWDTFNGKIRKLTTSGRITTFAGNGTLGYGGDQGPALAASFNATGLTFDSAGNLYVTDTYNERIRKIATDGTVTTVVGTGKLGTADEGSPVTSAALSYPFGFSIGPDGSKYFCDAYNYRVLHWTNDDTLHVVAGGAYGYSGDGGQATKASVYLPHWVLAKPDGSLVFGDYDNFRIRAISTSGIISTVAGNGQFKFSPNGTPALSAYLSFPWGTAFDKAGNLFVADAGNDIVVKIDPAGKISTVAGNRTDANGVANGALATLVALSSPRDVAVDANSNVYILDSSNDRVLKMTTDGHVTTVASRGFNNPDGFALDGKGNIFVADTGDNQIKKIASDGTVSTIAGTGTAGFAGDGSPATGAQLNTPKGVAVDAAGNLYIADAFNRRIRRVGSDGKIATVVGTGGFGFSGDGGLATAAEIRNPGRVVFDANGAMYISEGTNERIRIVTPDGKIDTYAGNGQPATYGDGGSATLGAIHTPLGLAIDPAGNVYIGENDGNRIRAVAPGTVDLQVSPATLNVSAQSNGALVLSSISIASSTPGLPFTASTSTSWLKLAAAGGLAPGVLGVTVNPSGLAAGNYTGTITVSAFPTVRTVTVTLQVTPVSTAKLSVNSSALAFSYVAGATASVQRLSIGNSGTGTLNFHVSSATASGGNWLTVSPSDGSATPAASGSTQITADPKGLGAGTYTGTLTVTSDAGAGSATVPVTMTITNPVRVLLISQTGLRFRAVAGGGNPLPQTVSVLNIGQGSMDWSAKASTLTGGNWLGLATSSGTVQRPYLDVSPFDVTINSGGLAPGDYYGTVQVTGSGATNTQSISVVLTVLPAGTDPGPEVRPTGLVFTGVSGSSPGSQSFAIASLNSTGVKFNSNGLTLDGNAWFVHGPTSGNVAPGRPQVVQVQPDFSTLPAGVRYGQISMAFGTGTGNFNNAVVSVLTVVAPPGTSLEPETARAGESPRAGGSCTPKSLNMQMTNSTAGINGVVGQPVSLEVKVVDDCGRPVTNTTPGSAVAVSFTTSDPQIQLNHISNGTWSKTWQPKSQATQTAVARVIAFQVVGLTTIGAEIDVPMTLTAPVKQSPFAFNGGVTNAASFKSNGSVSPGEIITIFGSQMADSPVQPGSLPLPSSLNGTEISIGGQKLPIIYANSQQVNLQVPFNLAVNAPAQIVLRHGDTQSVPEDLTVAPAQPAIFTKDNSGSGQGSIVDATTNLLAEPASPATAGKAVVIYCTGLGATNPLVQEGVAVTAATPTVTAATVSIGGKDAQVLYSGLTPNFPGLYQVNAIVPAGVTGDQVPVTITIAGQTSPAVTMAVR